MSRTYRRTKVKLYVQEDHIWYSYKETRSFNVCKATGHWDWENYVNASMEGEEFDYEKVARDIHKYRSDSGTRKSYKYQNKLLNNRYRELNRKQLRSYLRQEDGELQSYDFRKFDFGYWWD